MEEIKSQLADLLNQVSELRDKIDSLENSQTISHSVETAFAERLGPITSFSSPGTYPTQSIVLTGNVQTITVPQQPSGTIDIEVKGITYNVLYK